MMKRHWLPFCLAALLLAGCGTQPDANVPNSEPDAIVETTPAEPTGYYDPDSSLEASSQGAVRLYPLNRSDSEAIYLMGDDLLLVSGIEGTTLSVLSGNNLYVSAAANLDCYIDSASGAFCVSEKGVTYYDEPHHSLVFLDTSLKEVNRISLPEDIIGQPALSSDRNSLYYCTSDALRVIDLETGLDRLLREMAYPYQALKKLQCNDTVLECSIEDPDGGEKDLFISTETGETLWETAGSTTLWTYGSSYFCIHFDGAYPEHLAGTAGQEPSMLIQEDFDITAYPVLDVNGAVMVTSGAGITTELNYYDLGTGMRTASLQLAEEANLWSIQAEPDADCVWVLGYDPAYECDVLYRWDLTKSAAEDPRIYLTKRRSADAPDTEGLNACIETARTISDRYGVEILLWQDAVAVQPWDYTLTAEYQVPLIQHSLEILDNALSSFPDGFLKKAAYGTSSRALRICLVRGISGNSDAGVLNEALGIQFWDNSEDAFIALTQGTQMEQSFYHELFHIIESRVMSKCAAYDNWNDLNPEGFDYDYDYVKNLAREDYDWVEGETRAFIDLYSMSFPKEDRARIMEYAMMAGNESCFETDAMQQKLRQLCIGIREAFGLEESAETFRWEQYLNEPLASAS